MYVIDMFYELLYSQLQSSQCKITFFGLHGDLDLWLMTLTFKVDKDGIQVHVHIKFRDPSYHTYRDVNYCPVTFGQVTDGKRCIRAHLANCTGGLRK